MGFFFMHCSQMKVSKHILMFYSNVWVLFSRFKKQKHCLSPLKEQLLTGKGSGR